MFIIICCKFNIYRCKRKKNQDQSGRFDSLILLFQWKAHCNTFLKQKLSIIFACFILLNFVGGESIYGEKFADENFTVRYIFLIFFVSKFVNYADYFVSFNIIVILYSCCPFYMMYIAETYRSRNLEHGQRWKRHEW